ncbi:hypothetical protein ACHAXM_003252 [Skeletonema potamos]
MNIINSRPTRRFHDQLDNYVIQTQITNEIVVCANKNIMITGRRLPPTRSRGISASFCHYLSCYLIHPTA